MQIKRFEAKNMTTALRLVKDELGPEAVILSARSLRKGRGFFGSIKYAGVEVTAAIDTQLTPLKYNFYSNKKGIAPNFKKTLYDIPKEAKNREIILSGDNAADRLTCRRRSVTRKKAESDGNSRALSALYQKMLDQEVDRGIASELFEEIKRIPASEELIASGEVEQHLISILEEIGVAVESNTPPSDQPTIQAFIGTTGVGKTTTVAKLAAQNAIRRNRSIGLITLDNYGIAAIEHLNTYAKIIGIPMEIAMNTSELKRAIKKFRHQDLILIDTPGINPGNQNHIMELKNHFEKIANIKIHLVLSTTTKEKDLLEIADKLKDIPVHRLLFTKIDESRVFGNILNVLIRMNIPLSYLSYGRRVPDDIDLGSLRKLVDLIFKSKMDKGNLPLIPSNLNNEQTANIQGKKVDRNIFVANKNSDVYHNLDCKWAKKIKPENIIEFNSTKEAEIQNFLPCRSCNPDGIESAQTIGSRRETMSISSYR